MPESTEEQRASWREECAFCGILAGGARAETVYEDDGFLAFLDARPLRPGHVLVVPKCHLATLTDVPEELLGPLMSGVRLLCLATERAMNAEGTFVAVNNKVSQSVPHLHVHVVPRNRGDGLRGFFWPRHRYAEGEAATVAEEVRRAVAALR